MTEEQMILDRRVTTLEVRADNFEGWQKNQNGTLKAMNQNIHGVKNLIITGLVTAVVAVVLFALNLAFGQPVTVSLP